MSSCRQHLMSESNLFWVAVQSNVLADLINVKDGFKEALQEMKEELEMKGWIIPKLQANMRNQVNIANIDVEKGDSYYEMQTSIEKLKSWSSLVGEVPLLFKVNMHDWKRKKGEVLKHCVEVMNQKNDKNVVVLWDYDYYFKDVADDIKRVAKDKKVVAYPSTKSKKDGISGVKDFVEKNDHILVTEDRYFNGCEGSNVIFLTYGMPGVRNCVMRGVENVIIVELMGGGEAKLKGVKVDDRFL